MSNDGQLDGYISKDKEKDLGEDDSLVIKLVVDEKRGRRESWRQILIIKVQIT